MAATDPKLLSAVVICCGWRLCTSRIRPFITRPIAAALANCRYVDVSVSAAAPAAARSRAMSNW
jgi:hypothetical protein